MRTVKHFTVECKTCRRIGGWYAKPAYRSVQEAGLPYQAVHRRLNFAVPKNNPCEIREDFRRRSNALHHPVIYRSVKPPHWTVAYPAISYAFAQNDEAGRVLLRTGRHGRKSERICGTADFSPQSAHSSLTQKPISRKMEVKS